MTRFTSTDDVVDLVFESFNRVGHRQVRPRLSGPDAVTRRPDLALQLLDALGRPAFDLPTILVTGSKGKGSTSVLTARLLQAAGHRVGLITSPHLRDFRERIRLDGRAILEPDLLRIAAEVAPVVRPLIESLTPPAYLSPYAVILALGLRYFAEAGATALVIEAGRGGTYDDSNVVPHQVAVLTPIYLEHAEQLGPTVAAIAATKAGIILPGATAIVGRQTSEAERAILERAGQVGARALRLGQEIKWTPSGARASRPPPSMPPPTVASGTAAEHPLSGAGGTPALQTINVRTPRATYHDVPVPLLGRHQADNLAVAIAAAETLEPGLADLAPDLLRAALRTVRWPGRLEILGHRPLIVADAAINEESARLALDALADQLTRPIIALVAVPEGKDLAGVCRALAGSIDRLILTRTRLNRILSYSPAAEAEARRHIGEVAFIPDSAAALAAAQGAAGPDGSVLVVGTQSLIAEVQIALDRDCLDLW